MENPNQQMRIAVLTSSYIPVLGGLEIFIHDLVKELAQKNLKIIVIDGKTTSEATQIDMVHEACISLYRIPCPSIVGMNDDEILSSSSKLRDILQDFSPNIVNVQYVGTQSSYALMLKKELGFKLIISFQGSDLHNLDLRSKSRKIMVESCLNSAEAVTACSQSLCNQIIKINPNVSSRLYQIPSGVSLNFEGVHTENRYTQFTPFVLGIGRLVQIKGFDILIKSFAMTSDQLDCKLLIAGDGVERQELEDLASKTGIKNRIIFLGSVPHQDILQLLKKCLYLVIPSRNEGFSLAAIEALMSGRAIIASNVGGLPEIINDGVTGLLFNPENVDELSAKIVQLAKDKDLRMKLEAHGILKSKEYPSVSIIVRQFPPII